MTRLTYGAALAALALSTAAHAAGDPASVKAGSYALDPNHARVQFTVSHMGFSEWYGEFAGAKGALTLDPANLASAKVDVTIPVASVSTTNAKLDDELKSAEWFDAAKYPTIRFVSTKVVKTAADKATVTGELTFHGVTKPVTLHAVFYGAGDNPMSKKATVGFNATTTLKRSDFGVKTYLPMIGDDVALRISAPFEKQ